MPIWITVFCRRSVDISPEDLKAGLLGKDSAALAGVDYRTLAEQYDVARSSVDEALHNLEVTGTKDPGGRGFTQYVIRYRAGDTRPVLVHRWVEPNRVAEEIKEARERQANHDGTIAHRLKETQEVIGVELGISQMKDMGVVFAYEAARYLAQRGDGVIYNDEGHWLTVAAGAFQFLD